MMLSQFVPYIWFDGKVSSGSLMCPLIFLKLIVHDIKVFPCEHDEDEMLKHFLLQI